MTSKPAPAGKTIGKIFSDLRVFNDAHTRLCTGRENCETAEAYQVYEEAIQALHKVTLAFNQRDRGGWVDDTDVDGNDIRVWQNADGTKIYQDFGKNNQTE